MTSAKLDSRLAQRWFWGLLMLAVLAMGVLYSAAQSSPSMVSGITVLVSSLVLVAATAQAARIRSALARGSAGRGRRRLKLRREQFIRSPRPARLRKP
jgi:hypothetical protein